MDSIGIVEYKDRQIMWKKKPETLSELEGLAGMLNYMIQNIPWVYADMYNFANDAFGESATQLLPDPKKTPKTLATWCYVARQFPPETRIYDLSWSHYSEVASLEPDRRDELLRTAELEEWTTSELRKMIHGERPKPKKFAECPCCHAELQIEGTVLIPLPEPVTIEDNPAGVQEGMDEVQE